MRLSRIVQLRRPAWYAVKNQYTKNIGTTHGRVYAGVTGVTALAVAAALIWPYSAAVRFFSGYGLACFLPMLNILQLRRWNRTLAYPAALIFSGVAAIAMMVNLRYDDFFSVFLPTLLLCVTYMIGATSDRLSFIYKWKPPFDSIGIVAASILLFLVVYLAFMFFAFGVLMAMLGIALLILIIRGLFGGRRSSRWF